MTNADNTLTITGYTGSGGAVTIPNAFSDSTTGTTLPVSTIGNYSFASNSLITSVTIPEGVTSIGIDAFLECRNLAVATIPDGVTNIGGSAFDETSLTSFTIPDTVINIGPGAFVDTLLTSVNIPANVFTIGDGAFSFCSDLNLITVDPHNSNYVVSNGALLNFSGTMLLAYPAKRVGNYVIPSTVTNIGLGAFVDSQLTKVTIPASVTVIEDHAFEGCVSMTNVTVCEGLNVIGEGVFSSCLALRTLTLPASLRDVGEDTFFGCMSLTNLFFKGNAPQLNFPGAPLFAGGPLSPTTVYYLPGTTGWSSTYGGANALLWNPFFQTNRSNFGIQTNNFSFNITGTAKIPIKLQASGDLTNWSSLKTLNLTNGLFHFSEPFQSNSLARFYRITSP